MATSTPSTGRGRAGIVAAAPAITDDVSELVSVLDLDAGLAELVPPEQRAQARRATGVSTMPLSTGPWRAPNPSNAERARGGYGLLVIDGLLLRRVEVSGRHAAELLG